MPQTYKIMIVVGEVSGDVHAAQLVAALKKLSLPKTCEFFGSTGQKLRLKGVETIVKADDLSIVGLPEIARALPMFWRAFKFLKQTAIERQPDAIILVDFPEFNLKLAKSLKKNNLKIIYYISPQVWAWRKYRVKTIKKYVDLLLTILPFEKDWYQKQEIAHVEFVGNPLAGEVKVRYGKEEFCAMRGLDAAKPIVALLPGSRKKEIVKILPPMLETVSLMAEKNQALQFVIALASHNQREEVETMIKEAPKNNLNFLNILLIVAEETREVLNASDVAAVTSGTATLETAIIGTPMTIVYKTSAFNYNLMRPLIDVPHFGLINLIAKERVATELIQNEFTKENLSKELFYLLEPLENKKMRTRLNEVVQTLGDGGAAQRAAHAILEFLQNQK
ncbi:MAG: lipid-A-disaccharide synthase [Acidobacteria bacterium]|nr:lipid-A-disaccharide synthase [Acidobacteriota bacterium]